MTRTLCQLDVQITMSSTRKGNILVLIKTEDIDELFPVSPSITLQRKLDIHYLIIVLCHILFSARAKWRFPLTDPQLGRLQC